MGQPSRFSRPMYFATRLMDWQSPSRCDSSARSSRLAPLLTAAVSAFAASSSADLPHVHVQLISPERSSNPGANNAGLYFKLEPGWHVYWKNPGDAGEPPHIKWTLTARNHRRPASVSQSPSASTWPLDGLRLRRRSALSTFKLNVSPVEHPSGPATLHAKVDWLVCRGSCIPEKTELDLTRPIATSGGAEIRRPARSRYLGSPR